MQEETLRDAARKLRQWREEPLTFINQALEVRLDEWQEDCVSLYQKNPRLGLVASKGPGKTFLLAVLTWHFFFCRKMPKVACVSISRDHLKANLWAELLRIRASKPLLKEMSMEGATRITMKGHEGYSFIDARAFPKHADNTQMVSTLAGLHADNILFVLDEGGLIPDSVIATADAALSTGDDHEKCAKILSAGNPEAPRGIIYRATMGRTHQKWAIYRVTGDPNDPKRAPRVSKDWAAEQILTYGRDNPWVQVNVLGEYPSITEDYIISEQECIDSARAEINASTRHMQIRMGVDVARGGIDNSCIIIRRGLEVIAMELRSSALNGIELANEILALWTAHGSEKVYVDDTGGYGAAVVDALRTYPEIICTPVKYNAASSQKDKYFNMRSQMWVEMRDWIRRGGRIPNDPALIEELSSAKVQFQQGKMRIEEKEMIKARIGRSPDRADALAQTFYDKEQRSQYYHSPDKKMEEFLKRRNNNMFIVDPDLMDDEAIREEYPNFLSIP